MKVVILCGGMGTRLREETEFRPKPMVEVGGRPILWHIMKMYGSFGHREFVICLGYRANIIKHYFLHYDAMSSDFSIALGQRKQVEIHAGDGQNTRDDAVVTLVDTGLHTMTGGRVKRVQPFIHGDTFMLTYGDGLADVRMDALLAFHHSHGKLATVTTGRPRSRYGMFGLADSGEVTTFAEKPTIEGWANAGFFVFNRKVLDYLSADESCVLESDPMERLAADGQLVAYRHEGFFFAMDTYREFQDLNRMWESGNAPWKLWR
jgi:glucose-1-phosphate cytidylyltransferase